MAKKIRCAVYRKDWIRVNGCNEEDIEIEVKVADTHKLIFLSVESAKKLIKQLKKSLPEEGLPETTESGFDSVAESQWIPKVGEVVEVFQNTICHDFGIGEKVRVVEVFNNGRSVCVEAEHLDGSGCWIVNYDIRPLTEQSS